MAKTTRIPLPSQQELLELLDYDPETGALTWKVRRHRARAGSHAGCWVWYEHAGGFRRRVKIRGVLYYSARLIWLMMTGDDPGDLDLDHRDRDTENECWENLRLATRCQSVQNQGCRRNSSKGVCWRRDSRRYRAYITVEGCRVYLGNYDTKEEAAAAYDKAAAALHGEFAVLNNLGDVAA